MISFAHPIFLLGFLLLVPILYTYLRKRHAVRYPSLGIIAKMPLSPFQRLTHLGVFLRCLAVSLLIIALARPQASSEKSDRTTEGLDIMLLIDTSRSMEARDFEIDGKRPNRLEVIKSVIAQFVRQRPADRIGMVVFGTEAFTQAPLTLDHTVLLRFLERIRIGIAGDATAIGDGLATAVNRLKEIEAKSKVAILLTDGSNTAGRVDPLAAAEAALAKKVTVYTIGVGSEGEVPIQIDGKVQMQKVDIDENALKKIAEKTGGAYFRATDTETLRKVYETIDQLEKTKAKIESFANLEERFSPWAVGGICLLFGELLFGISRFRRIP